MSTENLKLKKTENFTKHILPKCISLNAYNGSFDVQKLLRLIRSHLFPKYFFKQISLNHFLNNLCQLKYLVKCVWKIFKVTKEIQHAKDSLNNGLLIYAFFQRPWWVTIFDERQKHSKSSFLMTEVKVAIDTSCFVKTWR